MDRVLLVEDADSDVRELVSLLRESGIKDIQVTRAATLAINALQDCLTNAGSRPDLIIVDLELGVESGWEVVRFWKTHATLNSIPLIVWTGVGGKVDQEMCKLFKVNSFVPKYHGPASLKEALQPFL